MTALIPAGADAHDVDREHRRRWSIPLVLICGLVAVGMFIGSGGGSAPVDALLAVALAHVAITAWRRKNSLPQTWRVPFTSLFLALTFYIFIGLVNIVIHGGVLLQLAIDAFSFLYVLVPLALLGQADPRLDVTRLRFCFTLCVVAFSVSALVGDQLRAEGFMSNPNMAAAWLGGVMILLWAPALGYSPPWRFTLSALLAFGLYATDSYSALLGLALALTFGLFRMRHRAAAALILGTSVTAAALLRDVIANVAPEPSRLESSRGSRDSIWNIGIDTWGQHFWGIGHGNFVAERLAGPGFQTHNDYLNLLVENGPLGLLSLLLIGLAVYRFGAGSTRALLVYFAFFAFFHNILNFRHVWLFIAIAIFLDRLPAPNAAPSRRAASLAVAR